MVKELSYRQIHLDFHTSQHIENIAINFDPKIFADTLEKARVNSITCFARCHHGWMYYDSKLFPKHVHPNLANKNLLKEQIEVCHKHDILVPIYITVQWDALNARKHPEWRVVEANGRQEGTGPNEAGFYATLCVNSIYRDWLKQHVKEVMEVFAPIDGLFFDIVIPKDCLCVNCLRSMNKLGIDQTNEKARKNYYQEYVINDFMVDMTKFVRQLSEDCTIFYNKGYVGCAQRPVIDTYSHFELETLPSGDFGYHQFPITARFCRNLGLDILAQTGRFHTSWGDFHSFKNKAALQYECFRMLALNAKCSIGDQLNPDGMMCPHVYDLIGSVYSEIERKEPWCKKAKAVTDIGLLTPEEFLGAEAFHLPEAIIGANRILSGSSHQFDILDSQSDFSNYKLLVLVENICVSDELSAKLEDYLSSGGSVIATYESGLNANKASFNFPSLGITYKGLAKYSPDFLIPSGPIGQGLYETEYVMYQRGIEIEALPGTEVLSPTVEPYFNRTYEHYCSHQHTPSSKNAAHPGITRNGKVIYFSHPIFTQYNQNAPYWCKRLFLNAVEMLLPEPLLIHNGPSTLEATLNEQVEEGRLVLHLLHYIPERRNKKIDVIEDVIPLNNIRISIKTERKVKDVTLVPQKKKIVFSQTNGRVEFVVTKIEGHQMISLKF